MRLFLVCQFGEKAQIAYIATENLRELHMSYVNVYHKPLGRFTYLLELLSPGKWLNRIRARRELIRLLELPDYLLKDIGLQREEIASLHAQAHWSAKRRNYL
jgi:uncharacterized protein YjiS (DUF1127 family)